MLDSWGKMPAGINSGNNYDFGHYDQCLSFSHDSTLIEIGTLNGLHCKLPIYDKKPARNTSFNMYICMPKTCNANLTTIIMDTFLQHIDYKIGNKVECTDLDKPDFGGVEWATTIILIVIGVLLVLSTIYDYVKKYREGM